MNIERVAIRNFRSIQDGILDACGLFNVLIGKNNSGKSNILLAIDSFFMCAKEGDVVSIDPPIGQEIDFHNRNTNDPIEISILFSLSEAEKGSLVHDIALSLQKCPGGLQ